MRGAYLEIDLRRIAENVALLQERCGDSSLMAVVKANGQGHGAVPVAQVALRAGARWLGVATVSEAEELRSAGIKAPIHVLGLAAPEEYEAAALQHISVTVSTPQDVDAANRAAACAGKTLPVHLKVDTGLGRIGVAAEAVEPLARRIASSSDLEFEGVFTHLAAAGEDELFTDQQIARFTVALRTLENDGLLPPWRHILNSAGILTRGSVPGTNLVRSGMALYGFNPDGLSRPYPGFQAALSLHARVNLVKHVPPGTPIGYSCTYVTEREMQIVSLCLGYADGYPRGLSGRGLVLIGGVPWRVAGLVSMDQMTVAVDPDFPVVIGEDAVLIGRQGDVEIRAEELARPLDTIVHEIVVGLSTRLPRVYRSAEILSAPQTIANLP